MFRATSRRRILQLAGTVTLGVLAGCTDDLGELGDGADTEGEPQTITAKVDSGGATEENEYYFDPPMMTVDVGDTVRWEIESEQHTVTAFHSDNGFPNRIPEHAEPFDSTTLATDDTFEVRFDEEGVYDYLCRAHEVNGMVGTVVVGNPDPDDEPGLETPEESEDVSDLIVERLTELNERTLSYLDDT